MNLFLSKKKLTKLLLFIPIAVICIFAIWVLSIWFLANNNSDRPVPVIKLLLPPQNPSSIQKRNLDEISILTLNMAHGRKNAFHQLLLSKTDIEKNLQEIADLVKRTNPDIVALQEADNASLWSGHFNHIEYLSKLIPSQYSIQGDHVRGLGLAYGTAILSNLKISTGSSTLLPSSFLTPAKGFVQATINLQHPLLNKITFVSIHLDFLSQTIRKQQTEKLIDHLKNNPYPIVIAGDLNSNWDNPQSVVKLLCKKLNLHVYQPLSDKTPTFPLTGSRIDWIAVSKSLTFTDYKVVKQTLSDHQAVITKVSW